MARNTELAYDRGEEFNQDPRGGEIVGPTALGQVTSSEIKAQVETALAHPRSIKGFQEEVTQLVTLNEATADECIYSLPRRDKDGQKITIEGPSARFAEAALYSWGNARVASRIVDDDGEFVTAQALFFDTQKNVVLSAEVKRRITDSRGNRYSADMVGVTSNAASSIARRNAILSGIPKALWKPMYDSARECSVGNFQTLEKRRQNALQRFQTLGVTPEVIFEHFDVKGVQDITLEHLGTLKGYLNAIREGDTTPDQLFAPPATQDQRVASKTLNRVEEIKNRYKAPVAGAAGQGAPPAGSPAVAAAAASEDIELCLAGTDELGYCMRPIHDAESNHVMSRQKEVIEEAHRVQKLRAQGNKPENVQNVQNQVAGPVVQEDPSPASSASQPERTAPSSEPPAATTETAQLEVQGVPMGDVFKKDEPKTAGRARNHASRTPTTTTSPEEGASK